MNANTLRSKISQAVGTPINAVKRETNFTFHVFKKYKPEISALKSSLPTAEVTGETPCSYLVTYFGI